MRVQHVVFFSVLSLGMCQRLIQFNSWHSEDDEGNASGDLADRSSYDRCKCEGGFTCYCVMSIQCKLNGWINDDGAENLVPFRKSVKLFCDSGETCCKVPEDDDEDDDEDETMINNIPHASLCGQRGPILRNRLKKDSTEYGEYPWMVAIFSKDGYNNWKFKCGGSLVRENLVLTAAHCVDRFQTLEMNLELRAGVWKLLDKSYQNAGVSNIMLHPKYSRQEPDYDIALLKTSKPFRLGLSVSMVCLPTDKEMFLPGSACIATGWGVQKYGDKPSLNMTLKQVTLPILSHSDCQRRLRIGFGYSFSLSKSFLCAGGKQYVDTCKGDGGGPLVCESGDSYYQVGIVSWGIRCGRHGIPGVYASVMFSRDWINSIIKNHA